MKETLKRRLIVWAIFTVMWLIAGLVLSPFINFDGFLTIVVGMPLFWGFFIMVLGYIPSRGGRSISVDECFGEEPPPTFDEVTDTFDEALGLRPPDEKELTFDELIARKNQKKNS